MWVLSEKILRYFWNNAKNKQSKEALAAWHKNVENARWANFSDRKSTYKRVAEVAWLLIRRHRTNAVSLATSATFP
jgi:mRNA-degrading endonuclease HigB of HigAB toxin-antitoxin module